MDQENTTGPINCACVIHSTGYTWNYVDKLYSMLRKYLKREIILHVYTEEDRLVPEPYVKHTLKDWGISGPKQSWWYKIQIFNTKHYSGPLLYLDLDTIIIRDIDWIVDLNPEYFWTVRDFKYLWNPHNYSMNSSIMWFNTENYRYVFDDFTPKELDKIRTKYKGDQDYLGAVIPREKLRFLNEERVKSWRWECLDGGYNFNKKTHLAPGTGTVVTDHTSVLIFHGNPKPGETLDPFVIEHWQ